MIPQVITFGEALLRFSAPRGERLATTRSLDFHVGGTEFNVAANLVSLGFPSQWVSYMPDGMVGELLHERIGRCGVGLTHARTQSNGRVGWYLMEQGAAPRPDLVYDRRSSCMAEVTKFEFDWGAILSHAAAFHTSGITAGMSESATAEIANAMKMAHSANALVSYDFNYRKTQWSIEEFVRRQKPLLSLIDILFCSARDLELFFGWTEKDKTLEKVFSAGRFKAIILGVRSPDESSYGVDVFTPSGVFSSKRYPVTNVDRIGVGDSMTAGFLASYLKCNDVKHAAEIAAAAGALKYTIHGDGAFLKMREVETLASTGYTAVVR